MNIRPSAIAGIVHRLVYQPSKLRRWVRFPLPAPQDLNLEWFGSFLFIWAAILPTVKVVEAENESTVVRIDFVAQYGYNIIRILLLWIGYTGAGGAFMNIRPSAAIRQNYNEIADLCRETAEPIFLTKNGEGDLVVMDIDTYNRREKMLKLREELLSVEEDRMRGSEGYSIDEVTSMMRCAIKEAAGHGAAK